MGESPGDSSRRSGRGNHNWLDQRSCPPAAGGEAAEYIRPAPLTASVFRLNAGSRFSRTHLQAARERFHERESIGRAEAVLLIFAGDEIDILPDRNPVAAPDSSSAPNAAVARPDTTSLARSEAVAPGAVFSRRPRMSASPRVRFSRSQRIDVPLRALGLVDADERRLAAHSQAYILRLKSASTRCATCSHPRPLLVGERPG